MRQSIGPIHSLFTGFTGLKAVVEMTDPTLKGVSGSTFRVIILEGAGPRLP